MAVSRARARTRLERVGEELDSARAGFIEEKLGSNKRPEVGGGSSKVVKKEGFEDRHRFLRVQPRI